MPTLTLKRFRSRAKSMVAMGEGPLTVFASESQDRVRVETTVGGRHGRVPPRLSCVRIPGSLCRR